MVIILEDRIKIISNDGPIGIEKELKETKSKKRKKKKSPQKANNPSCKKESYYYVAYWTDESKGSKYKEEIFYNIPSLVQWYLKEHDGEEYNLNMGPEAIDEFFEILDEMSGNY